MNSNCLKVLQTKIKVQENDIIDLDLINIPECLVHEWNSKVKQKFLKDIVDECGESLNAILKWYIQEIKEEGQTFEDYKTLRVVLKKHLIFLKLYFHKLSSYSMDDCLDAMEKILSFYVDMEVKCESIRLKNTKHKCYKKFAKHIILMLYIHLQYKEYRIYHVLMRLKLNVKSEESKTLLNYIYKVFLTKAPEDTSDLDFCRAYIVYQKWKIVRSKDWGAIDDIMYALYNRTPDCIQSNAIAKRILLPLNNLIANTEKLEVITEEYFRYINSNKTKEDDDMVVPSDTSDSEFHYDTVDLVSAGTTEDQRYEKVKKTVPSKRLDDEKPEVIHEILDDDIMEIIYLKNQFAGKNDSADVKQNLPSSLELEVAESGKVEDAPLPTTAACIAVQGKETSLIETSSQSVQTVQIDTSHKIVVETQTDMTACSVQSNSVAESELNRVLLLSLEPFPSSGQENTIASIEIQADEDFYQQLIKGCVLKESTFNDDGSFLETEGIDVNKPADIPNDLSEFLVAKKTPARYNRLIDTDQNEQAAVFSTTTDSTELNLNPCNGENSEDVQLLFHSYGANIVQIGGNFEILESPYTQECFKFTESNEFGNYEHNTHYNGQQEVYIETHHMDSNKGLSSESGPVHVYLPVISDDVEDLISIEANKDNSVLPVNNLDDTMEKPDLKSYDDQNVRYSAGRMSHSIENIMAVTQNSFLQPEDHQKNDCSEFNDIFSGPIPEIHQIKNFQGYQYDFFDTKVPEISEEPGINELRSYEMTNSSDSRITEKGHTEVGTYIQEGIFTDGKGTMDMCLQDSGGKYLKAIIGTNQPGFGTSSLLHVDAHNYIPQLPAQNADDGLRCIQEPTKQPSDSETKYLEVTGTNQSSFATSSLSHNDAHNSITQLRAQNADDGLRCIQTPTQQPSDSEKKYLEVNGTNQSSFGTSSLLHDALNSISQLPAQTVDDSLKCIQKPTQGPPVVPQINEFERIYQSELCPKKERINKINTRLPLKKRKMSETRDDGYPCEPVLSTTDPERNKFKTAAERKEMPSIQETLQFVVQYNDQIYNNSGGNYHTNNVRHTYNVNCSNRVPHIPCNLSGNGIMSTQRQPAHHTVAVLQEPVCGSKKTTGKRERKRQRR